jgi:hypothetical protein
MRRPCGVEPNARTFHEVALRRRSSLLPHVGGGGGGACAWQCDVSDGGIVVTVTEAFRKPNPRLVALGRMDETIRELFRRLGPRVRTHLPVGDGGCGVGGVGGCQVLVQREAVLVEDEGVCRQVRGGVHRQQHVVCQ